MKKIYKYILILIFGLFSFQLSAQVRSYGWQSGPPLNTPRVGASAVVLDGYIYVMGGKTTNNQILNTVERFDPATNTWDDTTVAPFMDTRYNAAAAVFNSEIYLIGGRGYYNDILDEVEVYNPQTNRWREIEKLDREREGHVAVLLRNHICVMGGIRDNGQFVAEIEWYNGSDWIEAPNDLGSPRAVPFAASVADSFYMFGGERISGLTNTGYRAEVTPGWFFNWTSLPDLQIARGYGASAILDNKMYMIAGMTFNSTSDHVEIFDLNTYQIENGPTFPEPRMGMTAATLNGDIYVIGGSNHIDPLTDVEIFTPLTAIEPQSDRGIPTDFAHIKGYPNPFNGFIQLEIKVPQQGDHQLTIYDIQGKRVKTIQEGRLSEGGYTYQWDARNSAGHTVAGGIYFAVLKGEAYLRNFKIVYAK